MISFPSQTDMGRTHDETDNDPVVKEALSQNLLRARKNAGLTQKEASEKVGAPDTSISDWERGQRTPNIFALVRLANAYGVTLDELVLDRVPEKPEAQEVAGPNASELAAIKVLLRNARQYLRDKPADPTSAERAAASIEAAEMLADEGD